jgi:actin-like ATPase involved in cell morphogenesis
MARKETHMEKSEIVPGCSIDVGTMNLVAARRSGKKVSTNRIRNAFIDLEPDKKRMLKLSNTSFVELGDRLLVLGDEALETANLFNREARRPMSGGLMASGELDSQQIISLMMKKILGDPTVPNEKCAYSVPAPAVDVNDSDITYHKAVLKKILTELGYDAIDVNEALAIIFSECGNENFSGLGISYGSGMTNVCLAYNAMSAMEFSLGRGGDYIDRGAAKAVGTTAARICSIKEGKSKSVDITKPETREEEAIALFVQTLIDYTIDNIITHFHNVKSELFIPKPVPIIVSGGTSLANGFLEKFKERFKLHSGKFPFQVSDIRAAADPMTAVSTGLLLLSQMD